MGEKEKKKYKYDVFISYKHTPLDIAISGRLQKKLEHYTLSRDIQKKTGKKRIERVFRDNEELSAGVDLNAEIEEQLKHSEFLVIICSKESKKSPWVNRELETFLKYHDIFHVLPVLVDGEPEEVYPQLLLDYGEPFAVDLRSDSTKGSLKRLNQQFNKLLAPLLYCSYDELVQRQKRYRMQRWGIASTTAMLIAIAILTYATIQNHRLNISHQATLLEESKLLSNRAEIAFEEGDRLGALEYLLQALPEEEESRPIYPFAQYLLTKVLDTYQDDNDYGVFSATRVQHNIDKYEDDFLLDDEGKYLFTKSGHTLSILDAESLNCIRKIKIDTDYDLKEIKSEHLLKNHQILLYTNTMLYLYNYETGERIWSTRFTTDIQNVLVSQKDFLTYVLEEDAIYCVNLKNGKKESAHRINQLAPYKMDDSLKAILSEDEKKLYFVAMNEDDLQKLFAYNLEMNQLQDLTDDLKGVDSSAIVRYDKLMQKEQDLYITGFSQKEHELIIIDYELASGKKRWEKSFEYEGNSQSHLSRQWKVQENIFLYIGRCFYYLNAETGKEVFLKQFDSNIINLSAGEENLFYILADGSLYNLNLKTMNLYSMGVQLKSPLKIRKATGSPFYYDLTNDHDLIRYDQRDMEFNGQVYLQTDSQIEEAFWEKDCLFFLSNDAYYYKRRGDSSVSEIPLPWDEIDRYDLSYVGYDGKRVVFFNQKYSYDTDDLCRYFIYDMETEELQEKNVSEVINLRKYYVGMENCYAAECANGRGKLYVYSLEQDEEKSYLYGKEDSVQDLQPNKTGDRILIYDPDLLKATLVDTEKGESIEEISLREWNQNVIDLYESMDYPFAKWTDDGMYFTMVNQDMIYLYDKNGKELQHFSYENSNDVIDVNLPYVSLSPDGQYLYSVYENQIYQYSVNNGKCLQDEILEESMSIGSAENQIPSIFYDSKQDVYILVGGSFIKIKISEEIMGKEFVIHHCVGADLEENKAYVISGGDTIGFYEILLLNELIEQGKTIFGGEEIHEEKE